VLSLRRLSKYTRALEQKAQLLLEWADCTAYIRRPASDFLSRKNSDFPAVSYTLC